VKKIRFRCQGCEQMYTLGEDAIVVTAAGMRDDFVGVTMFGVSGGISTGGGPESPDLVGSLATHSRSWSSLEPSEVRRQEVEVSRVMSSLSVGQPRWWRCRGCGTVQIYELVRTPKKSAADKTAELPSQKFKGKTEEEAKAAAMAAFPEERIVSLKTTKGRKRTIQKQGESAEAAIEAVKAGVPSDVSDVSPAEIIEQGRRGTVELLADSKDDASRRWRHKLQWGVKGASCDLVECVRAPVKGIFGIGAKQGMWRVHWSTKFEARISFRTPVVVTVWYRETAPSARSEEERQVSETVRQFVLALKQADFDGIRELVAPELYKAASNDTLDVHLVSVPEQFNVILKGKEKAIVTGEFELQLPPTGRPDVIRTTAKFLLTHKSGTWLLCNYAWRDQLLEEDD
jgi:hypothetical protein